MATVLVKRSSGAPKILPQGYDPICTTTQKLLAIWKDGHFFYPADTINKSLEERLKKIVQETPLDFSNYILIFIDVAGVLYIVVDVYRKVAKL